MAQTKTVHTLERARDAFANIKGALENKTSNSLDKVPVESYDEVIANIPSGNPGMSIKDPPVNLQVAPFSGIVANRLARALFNLDNTLYLMWNDKLYSYDAYSDSWTEYDSNDQFLGPSQLENPIADDAVLMGNNIVWLYVSGDKVHVRWYEVYSKALSNDLEINLSTPTDYTMEIKALCVDNERYGSDIYFYEIQNNAIYQIRLDILKGTATFKQFFNNATNNIDFYKLIFIDNNLYGIANDGLYKIEYKIVTKVVTFNDTTSLYRDLIAADGLGIIYSGGSKDPHSLYLYDILSETSTLLHTSTTAVYMDSCTCIKDGKIYRYVYRTDTGIDNSDYVNKFEIILDNIPVLVIGTSPASYSWGTDRYINTVVVKYMNIWDK